MTIEVDAQIPELVLQQGHLAAINAISFSKDGRYILSVSSDQTAKIWDPFSGKIITHLRGSTNALQEAYFSPNDKFVMTSDGKYNGDPTFSFWDPHTGKLLYSIQCSNLKISPNGELVALSNSNSNNITICYSSTGLFKEKITGLINIPNEGPQYVEFISDSTLLIGYYHFFAGSADASKDNNTFLFSVYNLKTQKIVSTFRPTPTSSSDFYYIPSIKISHGGKYFLCSSRDHETYIDYTELWDIEHKKMLWRMPIEFNNVDFKPDDSKIILVIFPESRNKNSNIGNIVPGLQVIADSLLKQAKRDNFGTMILNAVAIEMSISDSNQITLLKNDGFSLHCYSPKGNFIATSYSDSENLHQKNDPTPVLSKIGIWNASNELVSECSIDKKLTAIAFSNDEKYFLTGYADGNFAVWDITKTVAEKITASKNEFDPIINISLDSSNNKIVYRTKNIYAIHETNTLNKISYSVDVVNTKNETMKSKVMSPDGKTYCTVSDINILIQKTNTSNKKPLYILKGHSNKVSGIKYTKDSRFIYSWAEDGTCKKWNVSTGKLIYTFLFFLDHDYAIILPEGYYYVSSKTDAKFLNFKLNDRLYNFSQFDLQYNRPDKVLKAIGSTDKSLMDEYYRTWTKRVEKSHFNKDALVSNQLHVPEVSIRLDNIDPVTKQQQITISFAVNDSLYKVDRYNIFVNDVPLNGIDGKRIQPSFHSLFTQEFLLSKGMNKIEINCSNETGAESRKEAIYINYVNDRPVKSKTYFIGIGVDQYSKSSSFRDLNYCVKDIRDLSAAFKEKFKDELVTDTLLNGTATKENILALRQKLLQTKVDDKVIISFSGHGMTDPADHNKFYFVTAETTIDDPSVNGISYDQLEELLGSIPARKKLMLLDACHSGESDEDQIAKGKNIIPGAKRGGDEYNTANESSVQIIDVNMDGPAHASSSDIFKLMKEAFVDIRRNNGAYVISAAQSNEFAEENKAIGNGVFTHCLLEQLKNPASIKINELSLNINKCVSESTKGIQNTANRQELAEFNWQIW